MPTQMSHRMYAEKLKTKPTVFVLEPYVDCSTKLEHRCDVHNVHYLAAPYKVLSSECCTQSDKICRRARADKPESYIVRKIEEIHGGTINLLDSFTRMDRKHKLQCRCGHVWESNLSNTITHGRGCPKCSTARAANLLRKTTSSYEKEIAVKFPTVRLTSEYGGARHIKSFACTVCEGTWETSVCQGCPHCAYRNTFNSRFEKKEYKLGKRVVQVQGFEDTAIDWLLKNTSRKAKHISVSSEHKIPVILYRYRGRQHKHYPDIMVQKKCGQLLLIEVKSDWTFGLTEADTANEWMQKNRQKIRAALATGYDYRFMVFNTKRELVKLPINWYDMPRNKLRALLGYT